MVPSLDSFSARSKIRQRIKPVAFCCARDCRFEQFEPRTLLSNSPVGAVAVAAPSLFSDSTPFLAYLKIDGIPGDSQDVNHSGWINVLGFSESVTHPGSPITGGRSVLQPTSSDFEIVKNVDGTSPTFSVDCASGKHIGSAVLEVVETNKAIIDYKLSNVTISSIFDVGSGGATTPAEQVSFTFGKLEWDYTPVNADGSLGQMLSTTWDFNPSRFPSLDLGAVTLASQPSSSATACMAFLKLDGVDGSSQDSNHQGWIDVLSFSEGLSKTTAVSVTGRGEGKDSFSDLTVLTRVDKTTPALFLDAASGKVIQTAELEVVKPDGAVLDYKLSNVVISSVSDKGSAGDSTPLEQVSLSYSKVAWDYAAPPNADGTPGNLVSASSSLSSLNQLSPVALTAPQPATSGAGYTAYEPTAQSPFDRTRELPNFGWIYDFRQPSAFQSGLP
jgi:type VI secretion system secreted protein Hcp